MSGLRRRQIGGLAAGAVVAGAVPAWAQKADSTTLVSGVQLPANLDPHQIFDVPMQAVMLNAYDNLYRYQNDPPEIVPWLAESHTASADGLVWEFKLRPGIKFHDGSEMTAEDVVYSFRRVLALGLGPAGAFLKILKPENVTAPEKLLVRFKLETAYAPFFAAIPSVCIVNPRVIKPNEKDGDWGKAVARLRRRGLRRLQDQSRSATGRSRFSTWTSSTTTSSAGSTIPSRCARSRCARSRKPRPASWRCSTARSTGPTPTSRPTRSSRSTSRRSPTSRRTW
jgi:ABC-type transport system substrate-binding protein